MCYYQSRKDWPKNDLHAIMCVRLQTDRVHCKKKYYNLHIERHCSRIFVSANNLVLALSNIVIFTISYKAEQTSFSVSSSRRLA